MLPLEKRRSSQGTRRKKKCLTPRVHNLRYDYGWKSCLLLVWYHKSIGWQCAHTSFLHRWLKLPAGSFLTTRSSSDQLRLASASFFCLRFLVPPFSLQVAESTPVCHFSTCFPLGSFSYAFLGKSLTSFKCTFQKANWVGGGGVPSRYDLH